MNRLRNLIVVAAVTLSLSSFLGAQQVNPQVQPTGVPTLVSYPGKATDTRGKALPGVSGVTFAIYSEQIGGAPLWMETQSITADGKGDFVVQLGATKAQGLPLELFASGGARWLGVRINGGEEQPRTMLLSVPYALKAGDAATLGGMPLSAFVLAAPEGSGSRLGSGAAASPSSSDVPPGASDVTTTGGTANSLPLFTTGTNIQNSALTQTGTGATAKIGIGTTAPSATLDVKGPAVVRGNLDLATVGNASATAGKNSQPIQFTASAYNSGTKSPVNHNLRWQAEPVGNDTNLPTATLNFLSGVGTATPTETGLKIASNGRITFAAGQTFPGGSGTVTSVGLTAPPSDFTVTGSPVTASGTLALNWTSPPTNSNVAGAIVKRDYAGNVEVSDLYSSLVVSSEVAAAQIVSGTNGNFPAVQGENQNGLGPAILGLGYAQGTNGDGYGPDGVDGVTNNSAGAGIGGYSYGTGDGVFAYSTGGFAAFFLGNVDVDGTLSKAAGSFKIDHPLDPANKYLYHSFVESPDMMNIYNGDATLDESGEAIVHLPDWFESLNRDFRYQLTAIGMPGPNLHIAEKVHGNQFKIAGGQPGMEVSWQVTGVRHDAYADAHRIPVEQLKTGTERGRYLHPELFGAPESASIAIAHRPGLQKRLKNASAQAAANRK